MPTAMKMDGIREVLSPLLYISYVFGVKIVEFPEGKSRLWCGFLYILSFWLIYHLLLWNTIVSYLMDNNSDSFYIFQFSIYMNTSLALLSIFLGMCYDKKYKTCLKLLDIVDDTLEKIGMTTDYQKLYTEMLLIVFGWSVYLICTICNNSLYLYKDNHSALYSFYVSFMVDYPTHVNILEDLLITGTLRYIELKFEQINEYLRKLDKNNGPGIKRAWEDSALLLCQTGYPKCITSEYATWVVIHLHLELCKISRKLNSTFGLQMIMKMGVYFVFMAISCRGIFTILFTDEQYHEKPLIMLGSIVFLTVNVFRLYIINYMCEKVSIKANATGDVINRIPYSTFDVVVRENISQFLLQTSLTPLKFYGLGLFQFGLNFFYGFSSSLSTVIVIMIQSYTED